MLHVKWRDELRAKGFAVRLQNAIEVVNTMRDFEKRRLMELPAYQPISPNRANPEAPTEEVATEV
jgi:hypothetical protein